MDNKTTTNSNVPTAKTIIKLNEFRKWIKAPKKNKGNRYSYRTMDEILAAVNKLTNTEYSDCLIYTTLDVREVGGEYSITALKKGEAISNNNVKGGYLIEATAFFIFNGEMITSKGFAEVDRIGTNMSISQAVGSSSTYAKKQALSNLLSIDDTIDDDAFYDNHPAYSNAQPETPQLAKPVQCEETKLERQKLIDLCTSAEIDPKGFSEHAKIAKGDKYLSSLKHAVINFDVLARQFEAKGVKQ